MASSSKRNPPGVKPTTSRDKVRAYRARLKARGFRQIQLWLPDTRSPQFAAEARRQCRLINASPHAADDQAFVDAISAFNQE